MNAGANQKSEIVDLEMRRFLALGAQPRDSDPIEWWLSDGKASFPTLFQAAIKHLICPATSVPSERVFSSAGEVLTKKRNRLGADCANMIITLHTNLKD